MQIHAFKTEFLPLNTIILYLFHLITVDQSCLLVCLAVLFLAVMSALWLYEIVYKHKYTQRQKLSTTTFLAIFSEHGYAM